MRGGRSSRCPGARAVDIYEAAADARQLAAHGGYAPLLELGAAAGRGVLAPARAGCRPRGRASAQRARRLGTQSSRSSTTGLRAGRSSRAAATGGRGGIDFFLEPEIAAARLAGRPDPALSFQGEQYSLGRLALPPPDRSAHVLVLARAGGDAASAARASAAAVRPATTSATCRDRASRGAARQAPAEGSSRTRMRSPRRAEDLLTPSAAASSPRPRERPSPGGRQDLAAERPRRRARIPGPTARRTCSPGSRPRTASCSRGGLAPPRSASGHERGLAGFAYAAASDRRDARRRRPPRATPTCGRSRAAACDRASPDAWSRTRSSRSSRRSFGECSFCHHAVSGVHAVGALIARRAWRRVDPARRRSTPSSPRPVSRASTSTSPSAAPACCSAARCCSKRCLRRSTPKPLQRTRRRPVRQPHRRRSRAQPEIAACRRHALARRGARLGGLLFALLRWSEATGTAAGRRRPRPPR